MTAAEFNALIHAEHRLQICAILDTVDTASFANLRDQVDVSESVLSKQIKALQDAGYVSSSKNLLEGRIRTWVKLTKAGRRAYRAHVVALRAIVG